MKTPVIRPSINALLAKQTISPRYLANFDSTAAMLRAVANYLHGQDFPGIGIESPSTEPLAMLINQLPERLRETFYIQASGSEGIRPEDLDKVDAGAVAEWMVSMYPQREVPAVAVGSSSGAMTHLYAALGIPWLPQTYLVPVSHGGDIPPDEPKHALEWGKRYADLLLNANPDLKLHHMQDANQDRMTLQRIQYFRVKRMTLGEQYERFLRQNLAPGGTILLIECQRTWPTTKINERHIFQHGALGGATPEEFIEGSERVEEYLERYDSHRRQWDSPEPNGHQPEAEWGFEPALRKDVERFARQHGYRVRRVVFEEPEHPSPFVAELYRWWYAQRQIIANRLLVESFIFLEPYWALRTGSVPFWMKFNMQPSLEWILHYLDSTEAYDEIYMMLFSHGVKAVGLPTIEAWSQVLERARKRGVFVGVDEPKFPLDLAAIIRYHNEMKREISARYPMPGYLALEQLDYFIEQNRDRFPVHWIDHPLDSEYEDPAAAYLNVGDRMREQVHSPDGQEDPAYHYHHENGGEHGN